MLKSGLRLELDFYSENQGYNVTMLHGLSTQLHISYTWGLCVLKGFKETKQPQQETGVAAEIFFLCLCHCFLYNISLR